MILENFYDSLRLEITGKCNMRCKYCFASEKNSRAFFGNEMSLGEIKRVVDEALTLGIRDVALIGGEPLMHPDFWDIISNLQGMNITITTNAFHINNDFILQLQKYPQVKELRISLDGTESHNEIRIGSDYHQVVKAIKLIKSVTEVQVRVQTTLHQKNFRELDTLYVILKDIQIDGWRINPLQYTGTRIQKHLNDLDFKDFDKLTDVISKLVLRYNNEKPSFELLIDMFYHSDIINSAYHNVELTDHPCEYRLRMICVQADGEIIFCPVLKNAFESGNIRTHPSLADAVETQGRLKWEYLELKDIDCSRCKYINICTTGCRERALTILGNLLGPDPLACAIIPRVYKKIVPILPPEQQKIFKSIVLTNGEAPLLSGNNMQEMVNCYIELTNAPTIS